MHVLHSLRVGGLENGVVNLINHMEPSRFQHSVCCISRPGPLRDRILDPTVRVHELRKPSGHDWSLPFRLAALFRRESTDVVHTRNWGATDAIVGAMLAHAPGIIHGEHGWDMTDIEGRSAVRNVTRRLLFHGVDRVIAVSEDIRLWLIDRVRIAPEKIVTIKNGVDSGRYYPRWMEKSSPDVRTASDPFIIGTLGRLDPVKAQADLLRAFGLLVDRHPNVRLIIVGDGPLRQELAREAERLRLSGRVEFSGEVADPDAHYRRFDLFVLPSLREGTSNTILEAMATGLPVVATEVGGNPDLVVAGETGFLTPKSDVARLAAAMEHYIANPSLATAHGRAARKRIEESFSLDRMAQAYAAVYEDVRVKRGLRDLPAAR